MKIFSRILILLVLVTALVMLFADRLIARYVVRTVAETTGFGLTMDEFYLGVMNPVVRVKNLTLTNPASFPHDEALTVRELSLKYDRWSLLSDTIHLYDVTVDIPRVVMVRTPNGSNFEVLSKAGKKDKPAKPPPGEGKTGTPTGDRPSAPAEPSRSIRIDELNVALGAMEVRQYRADQTEPSILPIEVGMERSYSNVTNVEAVAIQIGSELALRSGISLLRQLDPALKKLNEDSKSSEKAIKNTLKELKDLLRK